MIRKLALAVKIAWLFIGFSSIIAFYCNHKIRNASAPFVFEDTRQVPVSKTGLLLGTTKRAPSGGRNPYFTYRIRASAELFKAGRIKYIIVSGDNRMKSYNEPRDMRNALIEEGIPHNKIYLDYAGFRTLDSIVRADKIFGQKKFTVISQRFHNERAVFIARSLGLEAVAYNAQDLRGGGVALKMKLRETLARVNTFLDLWTNRQPKFLGPKIVIP